MVYSIGVFLVNIYGIEINIPAQIFGLIGLVFVVIAYQKAEKIDYLRYCNYQFFFTVFESLILGSITGVIKIVVGICRNSILSRYLRQGRDMPKIFCAVFVLIAVVPSLCFVYSIIDIFPIITCVISTLMICQRNFKLLKIGGMIVEIISMTHSLLIGAFVGFFRQFLIFVSILIGLIRYMRQEKYLPIIY